MSENPYLTYYRQQTGAGGLAHFEGVRYQRGRGWFSKLGGRLMPALKYLGKNAIAAATNFLADVSSGKDVKTALKRTALEAGGRLAEDVSTKVRKMANNVQRGSGAVRRKRKARVPKSSPSLYKQPLKLVGKQKKTTKKRKSVKKKATRKK